MVVWHSNLTKVSLLTHFSAIRREISDYFSSRPVHLRFAFDSREANKSTFVWQDDESSLGWTAAA